MARGDPRGTTGSHAPPIKVLWLIKGLGPGGAEHLLVSTARGADHARFEFWVGYVLAWKNALVGPLEQVGVTTRCLGVDDARNPRWVPALRQLLRDEKFDVVHVHSPLVAAVTRLVLLTVRHRPPLVSTEHNSWASHGRWTRLLNRLTFRLDAKHIVVSRQVLDSLPRGLQDRSEVVIHGVDLAAIGAVRPERDQIRAELDLRPEQTVICTVANFRWQKGYPDLLAAAKTVIDAGFDVVFLAVGQGPLEAEIKARHEQLGLGDRFRLLGYRADAVRILVASDIFALASLHEGYPIAVMEAMVAGLPVVSTDAGGVPDAVHDGVEGFVVPSKQPEALAAALIKVISDTDLRLTMREAALRRGASFSIDAAIKRTQEIYTEAVAQARARTPQAMS